MQPNELESWYSEETATFGDRLAGAREAAGMERRELARRLGIKLRTLTNWEEDLAEPRANKLQMLAGLLNVSLSWLLTGQGEGVAAPDEAGAGGLGQDMQKVLSDIRQLKVEMLHGADRLGRLEKTLRSLIREEQG
ncbi:MAG TPA: XRE family transcriptional regulator [Aliiroseovarius sp.]|nr:XRE family transcriptional regulator [Aliiroseovarius sp.]